MSLATILQATVGGLLLGGVYALLSVGLTLIFGVMRVINFAQAEFMMLAMFATYVLVTFFHIDPLILAIPIGCGLALVGLVLAGGLLERLPRGDHNAQLILTLGVSLVLQNLVLIIFGPTPRPVVRPYTNAYWTPVGLFINEARLFACLASVLLIVGLYFFLTRTWTGRAMRATADDPVSAAGVGMNVRRLHVIAFMIGAGLAGTAGALTVTFTAASPSIGNDFIIIMFLSVVLGGLGSVFGAAIGAFGVGLVQSLSGLIVPLQLQNVMLFVVFVLVLLVRPQGLFGLRRRT
jgi:branched-chain amino acid transport system permease protein